jgi:hypothetical protein
MKKVVLFALTLAATACSSSSDDPQPAPTLTGNAWVWTSKTTVATPKGRGAITTKLIDVVPNSVSILYSADGSYTVTANEVVSGTGRVESRKGTYTYSDGILTQQINGSAFMARVDVLTKNNLTLVSTSEDGDTR